MAAQAAQNAYSQAMQEVSAFGKVVTKAAADALGVPVGTTLSSLSVKKSSRGSGSRKKSGSNKISQQSMGNILANIPTPGSVMNGAISGALSLALAKAKEYNSSNNKTGEPTDLDLLKAYNAQWGGTPTR